MLVVRYNVEMAYIYTLQRRGTRDIRYVGQTVYSPLVRMKAHKREARRGVPGYKNNWIRSIGIDTLEVAVLEEVEDRFADFREMFWIAALTEAGYDLVNRTAGGNGSTFRGRVHTDEQRKKWSEARKGSITGEKNPNWGKTGPNHHSYGRKLSEETKKKLSAQKKGENNPNYGKTYSAEERLAKSLETKGVPRPKSARSAHTRYHTNKGVSKPETCKFCAEP